MPRPLFAIAADLLALADLLTESGGDVTDLDAEAAITAWFAELGTERDRKLDDYAALILELEARARARLLEAQRLTRLADTDYATAQRLRRRLLDFFTTQGVTRLQTARYALGVHTNGGQRPLVVETAPEALDAGYQQTTITANTKALREALDGGAMIPGVHYGARGQHLSIR